MPSSLTPSSAGGTGRSSSLSQPYPSGSHGYPGYHPASQGYSHDPAVSQGFPPSSQGYPPVSQGYPPSSQGYPPASQGYLSSHTSGYHGSQPSSFSSSQPGGYPASHSYPALANGPRSLANGHVPGLSSYPRPAAPLGQSSPLGADELAYWRRQANQ